jgi:hypothetical protein
MRPLTPEFHLSNTQKFSSYLNSNVTWLHFTGHPFNAVYKNKNSLLWKQHRVQYTDSNTHSRLQIVGTHRHLFIKTSTPALGPTQSISKSLGPYPRGWAGRGLKVTSHPFLVNSLRICGALRSAPNTCS